jgi:hypothetical protein
VLRRSLALTAALGLLLVVAPRPALRAAPPPSAGGCQLFPVDNVWNTPVDTLPLDPNSATYVNAISASATVHADFGSGLWNGGPIGIPYTTVPANQPAVPVSFQYAGESDPGPYPIPANAPIEGGSQSNGDRHVLVVQQGAVRSTSCTPPTRRTAARVGRRAPARSFRWAATPCARPAGPQPMRRSCRSCRDWCATTR